MNTENPTYLGDAVYGFFDGFGIELRLDDHRNPRAVYLEPEVLVALNRFYKACTSAETAEDDPKKKLVSDELRGQREEFERGLELCDRAKKVMMKLPDEIIPCCQIVNRSLIIYHQERAGVLSILSALGAGKWEKTINTSNVTRLNYKANVDGVDVEIWNAAPPEGCKIVEEKIEIPAHTETVRKLVCH